MQLSQSSRGDTVSPSRQRRQAHALAMLAAVSLIGGSAVLNLIDDPRPLDVQLSGAFGRASQTLIEWQDQLSRGLHVSMLAVADGRELRAADMASTLVAPTPAAPATPGETSASAPALQPIQ
jgi:hypothetical protein